MTSYAGGMARCRAGLRWIIAAVASMLLAAMPAARAAQPALDAISDAYTVTLQPQGTLNYFVARQPSSTGATPPARDATRATPAGAASDPRRSGDAAVSALIVMHGHPRDAGRTLAAGELAAKQAGRSADTLVVAPLFQVASPADARCRSDGVPVATPGDALWTCSSWMEGAPAKDGGATSFGAMDQLLADLKRRWPGLRTVTIAGFSAGAQFVQRYIGFAAAPAGMSVRYVVADPSSWLYFDAVRPTPQRNGRPADWRSCTQQADCDFTFASPVGGECAGYDDWKYGIGKLPAWLGRTGQEARARYAQADVAYLEGELDTGDGPGTAFRLLDKSCGAQLQGPYRLQRGLAFLAYDQQELSSSQRRTLTVVPDCAHSVSCVFPSPAAAKVLFQPVDR